MTTIINIVFVFFLFPDTEHIYENIIREIAKSYNKPYPWEVRMRILGTTERMTAEIAVRDLELPITVDEFMNRFSEIGRKRLAHVQFLEGQLKFYLFTRVCHQLHVYSNCFYLMFPVFIELRYIQ